MPLVGVVERSDGLKTMSVTESYEVFSARMRAVGWVVHKFMCYDPKAVSRALHRWYDPVRHVLSKEHYPGRENEFWYKERV